MNGLGEYLHSVHIHTYHARIVPERICNSNQNLMQQSIFICEVNAIVVMHDMILKKSIIICIHSACTCKYFLEKFMKNWIVAVVVVFRIMKMCHRETEKTLKILPM